MYVLEIVREYFSTILQAFVVCSCFIVIKTPRFMDKFEDIVKDFFLENYRVQNSPRRYFGCPMSSNTNALNSFTFKVTYITVTS